MTFVDHDFEHINLSLKIRTKFYFFIKNTLDTVKCLVFDEYSRFPSFGFGPVPDYFDNFSLLVSKIL